MGVEISPRDNQNRRDICENVQLNKGMFRPLAPIGNGRANGKSHANWGSRHYHKCCWRNLEKGTESDTDMKVPRS